MSCEAIAERALRFCSRPDAALDVRIGDQQVKPASAGAYLKESELPNIKGMFWGHNVLAFAPFLETQATVESLPVRVIGTYFDKKLHFGTEDFTAGVEKLYPWWKVYGAWPTDGETSVLIGASLAKQLHRNDDDQGALLRLSGIGVRVSGILTTGGPEDMAIVGFDDIPAARFMSPPLTTVAQFAHTIGRRAVEMVLERLNGELPEAGRGEEMPYEIIVRESA